jgi:hypothetical protein
MRRIPEAVVLALAVASAGCPDSLGQRCPPTSLPSGNFELSLTLQHTADECVVTRNPDGGPPPADGSIVPPLQRVQSTLCAGNADAGATVYLVVANSDVIRQSPLDADGGFTFVSPPLIGAQTLCGCTADVNETISGTLVGGGTTGFTLGSDGGLVPQPTGMDGMVLQTLTTADAGACLCSIPCAEHYTLTGTLNR